MGSRAASLLLAVVSQFNALEADGSVHSGTVAPAIDASFARARSLPAECEWHNTMLEQSCAKNAGQHRPQKVIQNLVTRTLVKPSVFAIS